jgi:phosphomannomutase
MAATFKAYGIRVFCLDRYSIAPFIAHFAFKFKCLLGILVTGRDQCRNKNGVMIFNNKGNLISSDVT